jgi:hypothetical protein
VGADLAAAGQLVLADNGARELKPFACEGDRLIQSETNLKEAKMSASLQAQQLGD